MSARSRCTVGACTSPPKAATSLAWSRSLWVSAPPARGAAGGKGGASPPNREQPESSAAARNAATAPSIAARLSPLIRSPVSPSLSSPPRGLVEHLDRLGGGNREGRTLALLQNAARPNAAPFESRPAETPLLQKSPDPLRQDDGEVGRPIRSEIQICLLPPLADAPNPAFHKGELADSLPQTRDVSNGNRLITVLGPQTKAPVSSGRLERQRLGRTGALAGGRVDKGQPRFDKPMRDIEPLRLAGEDETRRQAAPAIPCWCTLNEDFAPLAPAQPSQRGCAGRRLVRQPQAHEPHRSARAEHGLSVLRHGLDPVDDGGGRAGRLCGRSLGERRGSEERQEKRGERRGSQERREKRGEPSQAIEAGEKPASRTCRQGPREGLRARADHLLQEAAHQVGHGRHGLSAWVLSRALREARPCVDRLLSGPSDLIRTCMGERYVPPPRFRIRIRRSEILQNHRRVQKFHIAMSRLARRALEHFTSSTELGSMRGTCRVGATFALSSTPGIV